MGGHEVPITWRGRRTTAWVPDPLDADALSLTERTVRLTEQAASAARRGSDALPVRWEALARLLLRAEGVASSFLEGLTSPLADVVAAELDPTVGETARWVADNLAAVSSAIDEAHDRPLTVEALHRWHRVLMGGARHLPGHLVGSWRDAQGWIGGTSPLDAALVPSPPEHISGLMADLVRFANREDVDPVTQAALAHAQFEVIHPYGDGNGRIGRILIAWLLTRRLNLVSPPPVSVRIAADRGGYLAGLTMFRLGDVDPWVAWFATTVSDSGTATVNLVRTAAQLQSDWQRRLSEVRMDAAAHRLLAVLPEHPVLSAGVVAAALGVSERTGREALTMLSGRGIVERFEAGNRGVGRPAQLWVARELIDLVTTWSRPAPSP